MKNLRTLLNHVCGRRQPANSFEEQLVAMATATKAIHGQPVIHISISGFDVDALQNHIAKKTEELKHFRRNLGQL